MQLLRSFLLLLIPGIFFSAALYLHLKVDLAPVLQPLFPLFPYLAIIAGLSLCWRFSRTRVLWVIILLIIVDLGLTQTGSSGRDYLLQVAPLLVPLNLCLYCWWEERGIFTFHGLRRLVILFVQLAGVTGLYFARAGEVITWLDRPLFNIPWFESMPLSQLAILIIALSMVSLLVRFYRKSEALEGSFCWVLASVAAGFWWPDYFDLWAGVAIFLLSIAIIESSVKMAFNDELTGLPARRAMNELLLKIGRHHTFAMVDVDHFKKVNDIHGHDVGDQVLRMVATCLRRVTGGGRAYRYGGEEFAIIFPSKNLERSLPHLEKLRETIARAEFSVRGRKRPKNKPEQALESTIEKAIIKVTVSIGVATCNDTTSTPGQLIKAADRALYKAKKGGRNRVCSV